MNYRLLRVRDGHRENAADELIGLWNDLDEYTRISEPVAIVDIHDEIRAGNLLGMQDTIEKGIVNLKETTQS